MDFKVKVIFVYILFEFILLRVHIFSTLLELGMSCFYVDSLSASYSFILFDMNEISFIHC